MKGRYWGPFNEFGPYSPQEDGWPNAGEVVRDFRKRVHKMSAEELALRYSEELKLPHPVTARWIQHIERNNQVPQNMYRRAAITKILGIPGMLLGLASLNSLTEAEPARANTTKAIDLTTHTTLLDSFWKIDHTATAQPSLRQIESIIQLLRSDAPSVSGRTQMQVFELLTGYYTLASTIQSDMCDYSSAFDTANKAVTLAKNMNNNKLIALTLYQRGFVLQERAIFTPTVNYKDLQAAIADYDQALLTATPKVAAHILLDQALAHSFLKHNVPAQANLSKAGNIIQRGHLNMGDFTDEFADINAGRYHLGCAAALVVMKKYDQASDALELARNGIDPTHTRRIAWSDIVEAKINMGQGDYTVAATTALRALKVSKAINSNINIRQIKDLHTKLTTTSYAHSRPVAELGTALILP